MTTHISVREGKSLIISKVQIMRDDTKYKINKNIKKPLNLLTTRLIHVALLSLPFFCKEMQLVPQTSEHVVSAWPKVLKLRRFLKVLRLGIFLLNCSFFFLDSVGKFSFRGWRGNLWPPALLSLALWSSSWKKFKPSVLISSFHDENNKAQHLCCFAKYRLK